MKTILKTLMLWLAVAGLLSTGACKFYGSGNKNAEKSQESKGDGTATFNANNPPAPNGSAGAPGMIGGDVAGTPPVNVTVTVPEQIVSAQTKLAEQYEKLNEELGKVLAAGDLASIKKDLAELKNLPDLASLSTLQGTIDKLNADLANATKLNADLKTQVDALQKKLDAALGTDSAGTGSSGGSESGSSSTSSSGERDEGSSSSSGDTSSGGADPSNIVETIYYPVAQDAASTECGLAAGESLPPVTLVSDKGEPQKLVFNLPENKPTYTKVADQNNAYMLLFAYTDEAGAHQCAVDKAFLTYNRLKMDCVGKDISSVCSMAYAKNDVCESMAGVVSQKLEQTGVVSSIEAYHCPVPERFTEIIRDGKVAAIYAGGENYNYGSLMLIDDGTGKFMGVSGSIVTTGTETADAGDATKKVISISWAGEEAVCKYSVKNQGDAAACDAGVVNAPPTTSSTCDPACADGQTCTDGKCVAADQNPPPPPPAACTTNADCTDPAKKFCVHSGCYECTVTADCTDGKTCDNGTCVAADAPPPLPPPSCTPETVEADCGGTGFKCTDGKCVDAGQSPPQSTKATFYYTDFNPKDACQPGAGQLAVETKADSTSTVNVMKKCAEGQTNNSIGTDPTMCPSELVFQNSIADLGAFTGTFQGNASDSTLTKAAEGKFTLTTANSCAYLYSIDQPVCLVDSDCLEQGASCNAGQCVVVIPPPPAECSPACNADETCTSGSCVKNSPPPPAGCTKDSECTDAAKPHCDAGSGTCHECLTDNSQCTGTLKACVHGSCYECGNGIECPTGKVCDTESLTCKDGQPVPPAGCAESSSCANGEKCANNSDCASLTCTDGLCVAGPPPPPAAPTCTDGTQNGDETGVDCGGSCAACPVFPITDLPLSSTGTPNNGGNCLTFTTTITETKSSTGEGFDYEIKLSDKNSSYYNSGNSSQVQADGKLAFTGIIPLIADYNQLVKGKVALKSPEGCIYLSEGAVNTF